MKYLSKIFLALVLLNIFLPSCHKNSLNVPPLGELSESEIANKRGIDKLLIGAYSLLDGAGSETGTWGSASSNWIFGSICGGEAYKGSDELDQFDILSLSKFTTLPANSYVADKWKAAYWGVQRANDVLRILKKATDIGHDDSVEIAAEARFLRGHYLFEAKKMWNNIPFVDETVTYEAGNFHIANDTSWLPIENDLHYAVDHLPVKQPAIGRINYYTAEALLAKAYVFQHKYAAARPLLKDIIENGVNSLGVKYRLMPKYGDVFNAADKNGSEAIFVAQTSVNDGAYGVNGNYGDALNFPFFGTICCGFFQPSQYLVNHFKTDPATGLPDLDHFNDSDVTSDQGMTSDDSSFTPYSGTLDPRLDWTVGRRGIPYLDWGLHPGKNWIRDAHQAWGPYSPIKTAYYQSQQGQVVESNSWAPIFTSNSTKLIRLADVLLWAAEVEVELGSPDVALDYVNQVRARAMNPAGWVHTYVDPANPMLGFTDIPAANYKISTYPAGSFSDKNFALKAIRYERMLELGMEGHRFFDLVRWGIADSEINSYLTKEGTLRGQLKGAKFTKGKSEYFPIPLIQITLSAGADGVEELIQNPGY